MSLSQPFTSLKTISPNKFNGDLKPSRYLPKNHITFANTNNASTGRDQFSKSFRLLQTLQPDQVIHQPNLLPGTKASYSHSFQRKYQSTATLIHLGPLPVSPSPREATQLHRFKKPLQKSLKGSGFRLSLRQNRYTNSIKTRSSLDAPAPTPSAPITPPSISNITLTGRGFQSSCHTVLIRGGPFRLSNFLGQGLSPLRKSRERVGCRIRTLFWNKNSDSEKPTDYTTTFWRGAGGKLKEREREEWIEERLAVQHLL